MKIKIKITKDVLERSKFCGQGTDPFVTSNCAIAVAVRDVLPSAEVGYFTILCDKEGDAIITHDQEVFVRQFDSKTPEERVKMKPFEFYIDVPESIIEKIGINEAIEIINKSDSLELVNQH